MNEHVLDRFMVEPKEPLPLLTESLQILAQSVSGLAGWLTEAEYERLIKVGQVLYRTGLVEYLAEEDVEEEV